MTHAKNNFVTKDISIDVAKGIGIILVVFGHTCHNYIVTSYIYSFHMPLFFFLTGFTFNYAQHKDNPAYFLWKRILRLMVPYYLAAFFSYYLYTFLAPTLSLPPITVDTALRGIINGNGQGLSFNLVLWFLPVLFCAEIFFLVLCLMLKGFKLFLGVLIITALGFILGQIKPLILGLDIAMTMQFFIYYGFLFRHAEWLKKARQSKRDGITNGVAIFTFFFMILCSTTNGRIDLMTRLYGQPFYFFMAGLSGSIAILMACFSFSFSANRHVEVILSSTGRASMNIFIFHIPISYCIASACALLWGFWIYYTFQTYWLLLLLLGVTIPVFIHILGTFVWNRFIIQRRQINI
jgi:acyltransferase